MATTLRSWLLNDVRFTGEEAEASEITKLLIKGRLKPVWEFFAERIRLKKEVEVIRGNLKLQDERRRRKCSKVNDDDYDDYEINVVTRSLHKAKKQIGQLNHFLKTLDLFLMSTFRNHSDHLHSLHFK